MSDDNLIRAMVRAGATAESIYSGFPAPTETEMDLAEAFEPDNFAACVASMRAALAVVRAWPNPPVQP